MHLTVTNDFRQQNLRGRPGFARAGGGRPPRVGTIGRNSVIALHAIRGRRNGYAVSTMKALMDLSGLRGGPVRPLLVNVSDEEREELREVLAGWKLSLD